LLGWAVLGLAAFLGTELALRARRRGGSMEGSGTTRRPALVVGALTELNRGAWIVLAAVVALAALVAAYERLVLRGHLSVVGTAAAVVVVAALGAALLLPTSDEVRRVVRVGLAGMASGWFAYAISIWQAGSHLYDFRSYLGAAGRWLAGGQPYLDHVLDHLPATAAADVFLYPPPLLPLFGAISRVPSGVASVGWVLVLAAAAVLAFRVIGAPWRSALLLLLFPPLVKGIESGNVANVTFLIFVLGTRAARALVLDPLFKVQGAIPALWLFKERMWREVTIGAAIVAAVVLLTLPLVGIQAWRAWWAGLGFRAASQVSLPILYGESLALSIPQLAFAGIAVLAVVAALLLPRLRALFGLGIASIVASPSLWPHGYVFAVPALVMITDGSLAWLVAAASSFGPLHWTLPIAGAIALAVTRDAMPDGLHPLADWPRQQPPREFGRAPIDLASLGRGDRGTSRSSAP
jgi:hypothetical protein